MTVFALGIDLGGTNLRVCLVDTTGTRRNEYHGPLPGQAAAPELLRHVADCVRQVSGSAWVVGAGLGIAGALTADGRLMRGMTNLPALAGLPVAEAFADALALPVRVDNDARVAMLGEARFGAARSVDNALLLTLGTGIGGGLLLDRRVRAGPHGLAGEFGLARVPHEADRSRWIALEDAASPGGLKRTRNVDFAVAIQQAAAGDRTAGSLLEAIVDRLAVAIVNVHVMLDLELVLLSGGMTRAGPLLLDALRSAVRQHCPPAFAAHLTIDYAALGEWAGAMGAAALWLAPPPPPSETP